MRTSKRIAVFGDAHGRPDLIRALYDKLSWESLDEIWSLGDLIDRGPDSLGAVRTCMDLGIQAVLGNHEGGMLEKHLIPRKKPEFNPDKRRTYEQIIQDPAAIRWMRSLPKMHLDLELNALLVHAGLWPWSPFYRQPNNSLETMNEIGRVVCHIGMAHPDKPFQSRWHGYDKRRKKSEAQHRAEGWVAWNEAYDGTLDVYVGHAAFLDWKMTQNPGCGKVWFLDTGAWARGLLTSCIIPDERIVQVQGPTAAPEILSQYLRYGADDDQD